MGQCPTELSLSGTFGNFMCQMAQNCSLGRTQCQPRVTVRSCSVDKTYQRLIIDRSQVIYRFALAQVMSIVNVVLNNCKQNTRHCHSWLARQYILDPRIYSEI